jgi:osmotically-inducible protein OsmY
MKNDTLMQHDVVAALDAEPKVTAGTVGVEVHHGVVKLAGCVGDDTTRDDSERAAQHVNGVTSVVMDVDVTGPQGDHAPAASAGGHSAVV